MKNQKAVGALFAIYAAVLATSILFVVTFPIPAEVEGRIVRVYPHDPSRYTLIEIGQPWIEIQIDNATYSISYTGAWDMPQTIAYQWQGKLCHLDYFGTILFPRGGAYPFCARVERIAIVGGGSSA